MTAFEWAAAGLILFGMVLPFWIMVIVTVSFVRQANAKTKQELARRSSAHDYAKLTTEFGKFVSSGQRFNGPGAVAYVRELKSFPEYRDTTLLLLEEFNVSGTGKFDQVFRNELKEVEIYLLGLDND
jgi:hypothetical protein